MEERLGRFVATLEWREMFPKATVDNPAMSYSDLDPILLDLDLATYP